MGLFSVFKKKENQAGKVLLAMPMFINGDRYELNTVVDSLKNYWGLDVTNMDGDNDTAILTIDGENVAIAFMPVPIPKEDIDGTAQYAYNWTSISYDLKNFSGHAIVSIMSGTKPTTERFKLLTKILYSILVSTNSIGVYQGTQSLLIPKSQYTESARILKNNKSPVDLWIYIGIRRSEEGHSVYTYGLSEFGKREMEIINSKLSLEELHNFILNICAYVINSNVTFKSGETLGYTPTQKIKITLSKGQFVQGETLKLEM